MLFRTLDWGAVPDELLPANVRVLLPSGTRVSFDALLNLSRSASRAQEDEAIPAALWLAHFGHTIGIRTPSARERARVFDLFEYAQALGLSEHELFSAIGNAFDPEVTAIRIGQAVIAWLRDDTPIIRHEFLH